MKSLFSYQQIYEFIRKHEPFNQMSDRCLLKVAHVLEIESYQGDQILIRKGEKLNDLYILMKGRLYYKITNAQGQTTVQGEFNEGSIIGEMALLSDLERSADVYTLRDSIVLKLTKANFLDLSRSYPELLNKITQFTIKRLTQSQQGIILTGSRNKSIAIIPLNPMTELEMRLPDIINQFSYGEKILLLTGKEMAAKENFFDKYGNISHEGILWINQQEEQHTFIFYLADPTITNWTQFCIRQADSLAFFAHVEQNHFELSEVEYYIKNHQHYLIKRNILILLHETSDSPKNSYFWLQNRKLNSHYHIQITSEAGVARLMRILTDNTIALVLSGGGARGLGHIGVFKLLEERQIPVDYIAGTSMGAMVAATFAMGHTTKEALYMAEHYLIKSTKIDFTFPYIAISSGKRASCGLQTIYGENTLIEDLWINYFCVSTDLVSQNLYVHQTGFLWEAIRASISLPFIYPPVSLDDRLLLDGGILNNIPVETMRQHAPNSIIIAANVTSPTAFKPNHIPYALSGWKLLYNKFRGKESLLPLNLGELVLRLLTISSHQNTEKMMTMANCPISLKLDQFGILDFKRYQEIAEAGFKQAQDQFTANDIYALLKQQL